MEQLRKDFENHKHVPFPKDLSENETLSDIFDELVMFDSYIIGSIDKILNKKKISLSELEYDVRLEEDLNHIINTSRDELDISLAKDYLQYLYKLKNIIEVAKGYV